MKKLLRIILFICFIIFCLFYLKRCLRPKGNIITIIVKLKDEVQISSDVQNLSEIKFPDNYFNSQENVKYLNPLTLSDVDSDGAFMDELVSLNEPSFSDLTGIFPKAHGSGEQEKPIKKITPLFSNYEDAVKVMNTSASNNQIGKYIFTNLFNYIRIEFDESHKNEVEVILKNHLYQDSINSLLSNIKLKRIIEYYYYPGRTTGSSSATRTSNPVIDYKTPLSISSISSWGTGNGVKILDFDEAVHLDTSSKWAFTEPQPTTLRTSHGTNVMGVLFGGLGSGVAGLVPDAEAIVVSSQSPTSDPLAQYNQFLHALALSYDNTTHKINYQILLIEVHNVVGVAGNTQKLPLESDPAMFYLIRLGAFGLNLIITEVAGNNGVNLDTFPDTYTYLDVRGSPLIEFNLFLPLYPIVTSQVNLSNATQEEIDSNRVFSTAFTSTSTWLPIWRSSPSGAILIAGYEEKSSGGYKCITNYGKKVKIIGPGKGVESFAFNSVKHTYERDIFDMSSAASAVVTGVIASALSKGLVLTPSKILTEGLIKNKLYENITSYTVPYPGSRTPTMKVPNVQNFYQCLGLLPRTPPCP